MNIRENMLPCLKPIGGKEEIQAHWNRQDQKEACFQKSYSYKEGDKTKAKPYKNGTCSQV